MVAEASALQDEHEEEKHEEEKDCTIIEQEGINITIDELNPT